ncbi:aspartate/glutamate racemase family protein [Myxococcota bacterium]|nr:aspartate/glutamate racemase family protein [Myxococcota bacterium]
MPDVARIVVIDAGFGGMGVVAALDPAPDRLPTPDAHTLGVSFLNATPSDTLGFNQLPDEAARLATLAAVLRRARAEGPDGVFVACNTLSALLPALADPAPGIIEAGVTLLTEQLRAHPDEPVLLLGTETTVRSEAHRRGLAKLGLDTSALHAVACPHLETCISRDPDGEAVRRAATGFLKQGLERLGGTNPARVALFLGCTHYSYRGPIFAEALRALGPEPRLLNPNRAFARRIGAALPPFEGLNVRFLSRYRPPHEELENVPRLLRPLSLATARAVDTGKWDPDLF